MSIFYSIAFIKLLLLYLAQGREYFRDFQYYDLYGFYGFTIVVTYEFIRMKKKWSKPELVDQSVADHGRLVYLRLLLIFLYLSTTCLSMQFSMRFGANDLTPLRTPAGPFGVGVQLLYT